MSFANPGPASCTSIKRVSSSRTGFIILGLSFGQSSGATAASFPAAYRYTASALTSDMAWLFGAGFAPLVALALSATFGLMFAGAYLLSGAVCTLIALGINRQLVAHAPARDGNGAEP